MEAVTRTLTTTKKKTLNKLKINDFPWTRRRIEDTGQTTTRYRETGIFRESQPSSTRSPPVEITGTINW